MAAIGTEEGDKAAVCIAQCHAGASGKVFWELHR